MGSHAYARLGYGYDLGGSEGDYKIAEYIDDLPWYDEDAGLEESANTHLRKVLGTGKVGIHFQTYGNGSYGYTGYLLFAGTSLSRNWVDEIEIPEITDEHRQHLSKALEVLGITPDQGEPCWLLATHYG